MVSSGDIVSWNSFLVFSENALLFRFARNDTSSTWNQLIPLLIVSIILIQFYIIFLLKHRLDKISRVWTYFKSYQRAFVAIPYFGSLHRRWNFQRVRSKIIDVFIYTIVIYFRRFALNIMSIFRFQKYFCVVIVCILNS